MKRIIKKILWVITIIYAVYFVITQIYIISIGGGIALMPLILNNFIFLMWGIYWFVFVRKKQPILTIRPG